MKKEVISASSVLFACQMAFPSKLGELFAEIKLINSQHGIIVGVNNLHEGQLGVEYVVFVFHIGLGL